MKDRIRSRACARPNHRCIRLTETHLRAVPIVKRVGVEAYRRCISLLYRGVLAKSPSTAGLVARAAAAAPLLGKGLP